MTKMQKQQLASLNSVTYDTEFYDGNDRTNYFTSLPINEDDEKNDALDSEFVRRVASYTAPKSLLKEKPRIDGEGESDDMGGMRRPQRIIDREDDYRRKRLDGRISPDRHDAFAAGDKTPDISVRTYADVMLEQALKRKEEETLRAIAKKKKEEEEVTKVGRDKEK